MISFVLALLISAQSPGAVDLVVVSAQGGGPLAEAGAVLETTGDTLRADGDGRIVFRGVAEGQHWVTVFANGFQSRRQRLDVADGQTLRVRIALAALSRQSGTGAEYVVGTVVEEGTLRPLNGAFVVLEDEAGRRATAGLAGEDGRFVLRASRPGEYRLVARLIGYADAQGDLFTLAAGETIERTLEVAVRAVSLEGIRVETGKRCYGRPSGGTQVATLWEEARKALEIAEWGEEHGALRFRIIEHRRELDASSLRVLAMREGARRAYYQSSPYVSRPAEELAALGFIQPAADAPGDWDYWGPDGAVLLSDPFLDTHCFRIHPDSDDRRVGLGFEPVTGRDLPEVEGVLWLDRSTAELERLEFRYVNMPFAHGNWPQVGGRVDFERLATGVWIVRAWHIRMPLEGRRTGGFDGSRSELTLRTLSEEGAQVVRVETIGAEALVEAAGATLHGEVLDEKSREPIEGAVVELVPTGRVAVTNAEGAYRMGGLPGGTFEARVQHPWMELLGGEPVVLSVTLEEGRAQEMEVEAKVGEAALAFCGRSGDALENPVVVYGTIRGSTGNRPVAGVLVAVTTNGGQWEVTTDAGGRYAVCVEESQVLEVAAVAIAATSRARIRRNVTRRGIWTRAGILARADLEVDAAAMTAAVESEKVPHMGSKWSNAMIGTVVDGADGSPVAGATVLVRDDQGVPLYSAVTGEDGQFSFLHHSQQAHTYDVTVEHGAYGRANRKIEFWPAEQVEIDVVLSKQSADPDPIVVAERRRGLLVDAGFYERLEQGVGIFIQRAEIERRAPKLVTDLLEERPGIRVVAAASPHYDIRISRPGNPTVECQPSIWVDGSRARPGGPIQKRSTAPGSAGERKVHLSNIVSPDHIEAIEVHRGPEGLPPRYGGGDATCGAVLIWTRQ